MNSLIIIIINYILNDIVNYFLLNIKGNFYSNEVNYYHK